MSANNLILPNNTIIFPSTKMRVGVYNKVLGEIDLVHLGSTVTVDTWILGGEETQVI